MSENPKNPTAAAIVIIGTIGLITLIFALSYALVALATWVIFTCFGWAWSWQTAVGVWMLVIFVRWALKINKRSDAK